MRSGPPATASLRRLDPPRARGVVLLLHGGTPHSTAPVDHRSASWQLARILQRRITPAAHELGVATWLLRYRQRGWNQASAPAPAVDARWALGEVRRRLGEVPVVLLGHSMGARAAVRVADDPLVRGVVALAPWLPPDEPVHPLTDRVLVAAHGSRDRITSAATTAHFVERARPLSRRAEFIDAGPVGHYLLRGADTWLAIARDRTLSLLSGGD